jgi:hypothetical protein
MKTRTETAKPMGLGAGRGSACDTPGIGSSSISARQADVARRQQVRSEDPASHLQRAGNSEGREGSDDA